MAIANAVAAARAQAWLCDDAFISFRYADHLIRGQGLVYNVGERVEGYSNFLWTMWTAFGMKLGVAPESWTVVWGIACYAATVALLCLAGRRARADASAALLPLAGLAASFHPDWNIFATSGLETSSFTFLVTLAYFLATRPSTRARSAAGVGLVVALIALARPDGLLFMPFIGGYVIATRRPRLSTALAFGGAFLAVWVPYLAWKFSYYGDWLPNTFYAKSAARAWYGQGWIYLRLYFEKYWPLAAALPLSAFALARGRRLGSEAALAAALAVAYTLYVLRVGGDFMFARLLIPVTPFLLILLERAVAALLPGRLGVQAGVAAIAVLAIAEMPYPLPDRGFVHGIVNERELNGPEELAAQRRKGETLRRYFEGLPVRLAIVGSQARLAYYARPEVVIESQTGLTDRWIARQPLVRRGRIGHEKLAPVSYLLERRVDFTIERFSAVALDLPGSIAFVTIRFDDVLGFVVHWDPALMAEMTRRGATVAPFGPSLDAYEAKLDSFPDAKVRNDYRRFRSFYFNFVPDSAREAPFRRRLAQSERRGR